MDDSTLSEKSLSSTELIDALNNGIIQCIKTSGRILPSSFIHSNVQCEWTEYASFDHTDDSIDMLLRSPVVDDLRQFLPSLHEVLEEEESWVGSDGRPLLYAACLGLMLSTRESRCDEEKKSNGSVATPLSTFLSIASFLYEYLDVDPNEPTQTEGACHRPPLHLLARSCYPKAVDFFLETIGGCVNDTDDEGWTPLMACCLPDIPSVEDGGPTDKERVETIRVLKNELCDREQIHDLEVDAQNYCGYTALHYACEGLNPALIECLLDRYAEVRADATIRTVWGESVLGIVRSKRDQDPEKAAACEAILSAHFKTIDRSDPIHSFLEDERKVFELMDLIETKLIPALHVDEESGKVEGANGGLVAQDRRVVTALMSYLNLDPSILFEQSSFQHDKMNLYEVIHHRILDMIPAPLVTVYCNRNPFDRERWLVTFTNYDLRKLSERSKNGARYIDPNILMSHSFCLHRQRGHVARQVELLTNLFVGPLQRTLSFAIPSNAILEQIIGIAPRIVEVGAGTGYWAYLLSKLGADIVAYDSNPPGKNESKSESDENVYFGSQTYHPVKYGVASTIFDENNTDMTDRALLIVWPNNPDAIDNPHVAVAQESLPEVWDIECLQLYYEKGGQTVIYVGERKDNIELTSDATAPDWGFCASRRFQQFLQQNFELKRKFECPKWWMKEDDVTVWKRL